MKKAFFLSVILIIQGNIIAQDTINVVYYNLLNYGLPVYGCNNSNNNPEDKDAYLRTIYSHTKPDIFAVNEMRVESNDSSPVDWILDNVLNIHFNPLYQRAYITNLAGSHIINMLYYNTSKLVLYSQDVIAAYRDINIYTLYYKSADLAETNDTAFIHCIVTHLKSSQGADNEAIRAEMTSLIIDYIEMNNLGGNIMMMGDFNVYTDQEEAFQNLINPENPEIAFYDPIETIGSWHNNESYVNVHTQSTHSTYNDCAASGGMDDRFDFILMDEKLITNDNHYGYIEGTYTALGNDGTCFNQASLLCDNPDLSDDLKNALYFMSDHLPIVLKLGTDQTPAVNTIEKEAKIPVLNIKNPVKETMQLELVNKLHGEYKILLYSTIGEMIISNTSLDAICNIPLTNVNEGIYILKVIDPLNNTATRKIVVVN